MSPHAAGQFGSVRSVAPGGQHPSSGPAPTGIETQRALHVPPSNTESTVHIIASSQAVGQAPAVPAAIAVSQVSVPLTNASPQTVGQSSSFARVAPLGQQPSPFAGALMS
jgi:hypothetical protein